MESDIDPFRGLLLGLFFMTVGAAIDFDLLFGSFAAILGLTIGMMLLKGAVLYGLGVFFGLKGQDRWLLALGLAQAGEFGFVLLSFTVANSVIPGDLADQLLLVVALSMLLTPALFILYDRVIAPRYVEDQAQEPDEIEEKGTVIIAGMGRVGGLVDRMMMAAGYTTTVIDYSSKQLDNMRVFGAKAYYGDATRPDLLHAAGMAEAKVFVVAIDGEEQINEVVRYVLKAYPHVHVIARAVNRHHVYELYAMGCRDIIRETYDSSIRIGRSVYEAMGIARDKAQAMADAFDRMDREAMIEVAPHFDPDIPATQNQAYVDKV